MCKISAAVIAVAIAAITTAGVSATTSASDSQWIQLESNSECNVGAGEVYQKPSSGRVSDLGACQKSCEDSALCQSITYYKSGWCSHFSTGCTLRKFNAKAIMSMLWADSLQVTAVAAGQSHTVVLKQDGCLWATGDNEHGQLGDGSNENKNAFVKVVAPTITDSLRVTAVAAGSGHTVVLKQDGSVWATGRNDNGQLGDGSWSHKNRFAKVIATAMSGFVPVITVAAGHAHTLVVKQDGSLWVTGFNRNGGLGDGSEGLSSSKNSFVKVIASGVKAVAGGWVHTMVVKQDGSLWATGANYFGQLGDGTTTDKKSFVKVMTSGVKAVSASERHTMVVKQDGSLWTTGYNEDGRLGDGSWTEKNHFVKVVPTTIKGCQKWCARNATEEWSQKCTWSGKCDGCSECFGSTTSTVPAASTSAQQPADFLQVTAVATNAHTMVVKQDGSLWATGWNGFGQLGNGKLALKNSFVKVIASGVKAVAAGDYHTMVVKQDGSLWATGRCDYGQLGDGSEYPELSKLNFEQVIAITSAITTTNTGCPKCPGSTTRTATTASTSAQNPADCQTWCARNAKEWSQKCTWSGKCDGCSECFGSATSTVPAASTSAQQPAGCQKWCARNAKKWSQKCTWSGKCDGCSECPGSATSTVPAASTSAQQPAECKKWCVNHKQPWKTKCTWVATCDGCSECLGGRAQAEGGLLLTVTHAYPRMNVTASVKTSESSDKRITTMMVVVTWLFII